MGFWMLLPKLYILAQLPTGQLSQKMKHLLQVEALPGSHLSWQNPEGFFFFYFLLRYD